MTNWINEYIDQYYDWLKKKTFTKVDSQTGWVAIATPYVGLFNDTIEIYVRKEGEKIFLSDDGVTLRNLDLAGVNISRSGKRKEWLDFILMNYGIKFMSESGELITESNISEFPQKKHDMICAISEISDMEISAKHIVSSLFREDIRKFLDEQDITYSPQFIVKGKTGIDFTFDFQVMGRTKELVIKSFNTLNRTNVPSFLFSYGDVKSVRELSTSKELLSLAIINDEDRDIKPEFISALKEENVDVMYWSRRNNIDSINKLRITA